MNFLDIFVYISLNYAIFVYCLNNKYCEKKIIAMF